MKIRCLQNILFSAAIAITLSMTACSTTNRINLKIHTEPEGAHIVYQLDQNRWTYLGVTPLESIEMLSDDEIQGNHSFTLKAMRCGYIDQTKEWTGDSLLLEHGDQGMIFWTPRLIKNTE